MLRIGLTGGIGSGKTTVADLLRAAGFIVVDADLIAREIVRPHSPALKELAEAFGKDIIESDGSLDRALLAQRAFVDEEHTALLNSITHPRIAEETARQFAAAEADGAPLAVYDMPLLVDKGLHREMDFVIVVDVDSHTRIQRLVGHRGLSHEDARRRIAAQVDDATRREAADLIIDNNGPRESLIPQVESLIDRLRAL